MAELKNGSLSSIKIPFNITETVCPISTSSQKIFQNSCENTPSETIYNKGIISEDTIDNKKYKYIKTENVHLFLSELFIGSIERLQWIELCKSFDFTKPVDPRLFFDNLTLLNCGKSLIKNTAVSNLYDNNNTQLQKNSINKYFFQLQEGNSTFYLRHGTDSKIQENLNVEDETQKNCNKIENANSNLLYNNSNITMLLNKYLKRERQLSLTESDSLSENNSTISNNLNSTDDLTCIDPYVNSPQDLVLIPKEFQIKNFLLAQKNNCSQYIWTPPAKEFIVNLNTASYKDIPTILIQQNYRCAGCCMKFNKFYAKRCRLCYYFSKVFCQCCHQGEKSLIPAFILHNWNFKLYPVCDTAFCFLRDNEDQPVFNLSVINPSLYRKIKNLNKVNELRIQASHMWQYIQMCDITENYETKGGYGFLKTMFVSVPRRLIILEHVDIFSMLDLVSVVNRNLIELLEPLVQCGNEHINCQERAFFCQICLNPKQFLFPFQLKTVYRCIGCGALSHLKCRAQKLKQLKLENKYEDGFLENGLPCLKCERIQKKRVRQLHRSLSRNSE